MHIVTEFVVAAVAAGISGGALANGGGSMLDSTAQMLREQSPKMKAHDAYNEGVRSVKKGDKAQEYAGSASDAGRKDKATREAQEAYAQALVKFKQALGYDDSLAEAWNYAGYTSRKLGHYEEALAAYGKALSLKPGYADALEYRGEAFLALNRVQDAQQSYLDLYAGSRTLAGKFLGAMKSWASAQRAVGADAAHLDELDLWIKEREQIAGQTAALTRAGAAASWR